MKGDPCYKVAENLAKFSSSIRWKSELVINELGYLAEEISRHHMEGVALFLLDAYSKI